MLSRVYVRAPNHLGDGVMAMPAIAALAAASRQTVVAAPGWGAQLYRDLGVQVVQRGEVPDADLGVLLAPSLRAALEAWRLPRRVGVVGDWRRWLLTDPLPKTSEHRAAEYARIVEAIGVEVAGPPRFVPTAEERGRAEVPQRHLALIPVSPSGPPVMWGGFAALAARWPGPKVVYLGPGERWETDLPVQAGLPLGALAACLERAAVVVVNDSGLAHFARAVGAPTVVVFGSTAPGRTGAAGAVAVEGPALDCRPCYRKRCPYAGVPCLAGVSVDEVERIARRVVEES